MDVLSRRCTLRQGLLGGWAAAAMVAGAIVQPASVQAAPKYTGQVVVSNLLNPRGLTADSFGRILVSEGGRGGDTCDVEGAPPGPPTALRCWGKTGAIGRYDPATSQYSQLWTGLDSIAKSSNPADLSPVAGLQDLTYTSDGRLLGIFGFRGKPATRPDGTLFAKLVKFDDSNPGAAPAILADLGAFETSHPSHTPPFSNPFSLAWHAGTSYVTDAGANRLLKVVDNTSIVELLEDFPTVSTPTYAAEAVPTGLTVNTTGTLYNTQLPGFPFLPGTASIFRSDGMPNSAQAISSGYTNVMDMSLGTDGWLYLVQYAQDFSNPAGTGSLIRYNPLQDIQEVLAEKIDRPTGVLALADGTIYVATGGSTTNGSLVRYTPGPLPIGGAVLAWRHARGLRRRIQSRPRA